MEAQVSAIKEQLRLLDKIEEMEQKMGKLDYLEEQIGKLNQLDQLQEQMRRLLQATEHQNDDQQRQRRGHGWGNGQKHGEPQHPPTHFTKMEFPCFHGTEVDSWISKCERFFHLDGTPEAEKVMIASTGLDNASFAWHVASERRWRRPMGWNEYVVLLRDTYGLPVDKTIGETCCLARLQEIAINRRESKAVGDRPSRCTSNSSSGLASNVSSVSSQATAMTDASLVQEDCHGDLMDCSSSSHSKTLCVPKSLADHTATDEHQEEGSHAPDTREMMEMVPGSVCFSSFVDCSILEDYTRVSRSVELVMECMCMKKVQFEKSNLPLQLDVNLFQQQQNFNETILGLEDNSPQKSPITQHLGFISPTRILTFVWFKGELVKMLLSAAS